MAETSVPASGSQHLLRFGDYEAEIAGVGASVRAVRHRGRDLIATFDAEEVRPAMRGALLAPWPNRIADGRYAFDGAMHELTVNESVTRTAAHGLVAWVQFEPAGVEPHAAELSATIQPQPGYPWRVRLDVRFELSADGLRQTVSATNLSSVRAPFGVGGHPYLVAGPSHRAAIDDWELELPADSVLLVSEDRLLPTELAAVSERDGGRFDFRRPRIVGGSVLNHAFTSIRRDADGVAAVTLTYRNGLGSQLEFDRRIVWVQLYTADEARDDDRRHALAVEPMTCPPDAFNSGTDLLALEPGATTSVAWTLRAVMLERGQRIVHEGNRIPL